MAVATKYRTAQLKDEIDANGTRIGGLEKSDAAQNIHIDRLRDEVIEHDKCIRLLEKFSITAGQTLGFARWVMVGFGVYVIALIWQLITGQVILQFP